MKHTALLVFAVASFNLLAAPARNTSPALSAADEVGIVELVTQQYAPAEAIDPARPFNIALRLDTRYRQAVAGEVVQRSPAPQQFVPLFQMLERDQCLFNRNNDNPLMLIGIDYPEPGPKKTYTVAAVSASCVAGRSQNVFNVRKAKGRWVIDAGAAQSR